MYTGLSQSAKHDSDHADVKPGFGMGRLDFIVAHQATMFHKPAKSPLDNPAFWQSRKAAPGLVPRHDFQPQRARFAVRRHPSGEIISTVALIGPQTAQPPKASQHSAQEVTGTSAFGHIGSGDTDRQQQSQGVHQEMAFDPLGFLGRIVAPLPRLIGRTDRLAIQDGRRGLRAFPDGVAHGLTQQIVDDLPAALLGPKPEVMVNRLPRAKVTGQEAPGTTGAHEVKQRVADAAQVRRRTTAAFASLAGRYHHLQEIPLFISQIRWIQSCILHPARLEKPLGHPLSKDSKMIFQTRSNAAGVGYYTPSAALYFKTAIGLEYMDTPDGYKLDGN